MKHSSHTLGPPAEIDDNTKRWLVVGICLHRVLAAALRKYVEPVITNLYNSLKLSDQIDKQTYTGHLKVYGAVNFYLNYKPINNNKMPPGNRAPNYDYKVQNAVDLSKLFLETSMAHYKGFDESCDSSALLGIIVNTDKFPANVQIAAKDVRQEIRNRWTHCDFTEWNSDMYNWSLQKIEDFIYLLQLNKPEESQAIRDLNKWKTNGINYLGDTTLGLELVNDIRREITSIMEVEMIICKSADREFSTVYTKLTEIGNRLNKHDKRISSLENKVALQDTTLLKYKSLYDAEPVINSWMQKMEIFVETNVVIDILEILKDNHCALLIGVSGMGKTLTAQNVALRLWHEKEYSIVPCSSLNDIQTRYRDNVNQVFFVDDICGRYTTNIMKIENWMNIEEFVKCILVKGKTKILATCRTEVFLEEIFQDTFEIFRADVDARNGWFTPLTAACRDGHLGTVEILLNKGSIVNQTNIYDETPLYTACICGHYGLAKRLIKRRADINKPNKYNHTPLYVSCMGGYENILRLLIDEGATVCDCSDSLIGATHGGHDKIVETLVTEVCDINYVDVQGRTALFIACEEGYTKIVRLLLDKNADICKGDCEGNTPLDAARSAGNDKIVSMLIQINSNVNMRHTDDANISKVYKNELTPLELTENDGQLTNSMIFKSLKTSKLLPNKGLHISEDKEKNYKEQKPENTRQMLPYGWTPLYEACTRGDMKKLFNHSSKSIQILTCVILMMQTFLKYTKMS
ncbi:unnamed protein product [Mytilus edulis]|uniref:Novel STAND NTPase 3 domain-containing protein n=1 Tax=Mytilus edulis TaxID=6550 RepID=A0A8S3QVE2_MYTED|nr:unnamed protein product [Mytilus edulis]